MHSCLQPLSQAVDLAKPPVLPAPESAGMCTMRTWQSALTALPHQATATAAVSMPSAHQASLSALLKHAMGYFCLSVSFWEGQASDLGMFWGVVRGHVRRPQPHQAAAATGCKSWSWGESLTTILVAAAQVQTVLRRLVKLWSCLAMPTGCSMSTHRATRALPSLLRARVTASRHRGGASRCRDQPFAIARVSSASLQPPAGT